MASPSKKAWTTRVPLRRTQPFRTDFGWAQLDVFGQTILLKELTHSLGSFQQACVALRILPYQAECFVENYLEQRQAYELGARKLQQWVREMAVPSGDDDDDIPQQRPFFIQASSVAPACDFLEKMGYPTYVPSVRAWVNRLVVWPPKIDVTDLNLLALDVSNYNLTRVNTSPDASNTVALPKQSTRIRYECALGNDPRAMLGLLARPQPKNDGTPDMRISFINISKGSLAYGPHGVRQLDCSGQYSICWPIDEPVDGEYQDFLLAANTLNCAQREGGNEAPTSDGNTNAEEARVPFHTDEEPQGPSRAVACSELSQLSKNWSGLILQFRLPHNYTIIGPQGYSQTFDPSQHDTRDDSGNLQGTGGTYYILSPPQPSSPAHVKLAELPNEVAFRLSIPEKAVILRNGGVLPRFVEPGLHEWSTREGNLDFYSANGSYEVFRSDRKSEVLQHNSEQHAEIQSIQDAASERSSGSDDPEPAVDDLQVEKDLENTASVQSESDDEKFQVEWTAMALQDDSDDEDYKPPRARKPRKSRAKQRSSESDDPEPAVDNLQVGQDLENTASVQSESDDEIFQVEWTAMAPQDDSDDEDYNPPRVRKPRKSRARQRSSESDDPELAVDDLQVGQDLENTASVQSESDEERFQVELTLAAQAYDDSDDEDYKPSRVRKPRKSRARQRVSSQG